MPKEVAPDRLEKDDFIVKNESDVYVHFDPSKQRYFMYRSAIGACIWKPDQAWGFINKETNLAKKGFYIVPISMLQNADGKK